MDKWHDFYLMLGPSAAALVGLLFVVVTLTSGMDSQKAAKGVSLYMSPIVVHLGVVILLSGVALAPDTPVAVLAGLLLACGVAGVPYAVFIVRGMTSRDMETYTSDIWWYGVAVGLFYAALAITGVVFLFDMKTGALLLAGVLMGFLLLTIHNAWDLISYMAPRVDRAKKS